MISIGVLPYEVLLAIFDLYMDEARIEAWQLLAHVCRRWRSVVFGSPRRLKLRLICRTETPARDTLDIWPAIPLLIQGSICLAEDVDNIIAALECSDRVAKIKLFTNNVDSSPWEKVFEAMQEPFPELTDLDLHSYAETAPIAPDSFLGGSAPNLRTLSLNHIPFPGLQKLLLSATHLVTLDLRQIPHSGFFSPDALSTLTSLDSLESLRLEFESHLSRPDRASRRPPPPKRSVLPALINFEFKGVSEYLDDLVARIDAPQLNCLQITFFNQLVFDTPQLIQFINRTPTFKALEEARVNFTDRAAIVYLSSHIPGFGPLRFEILCYEFGWQVSSVEQVFSSCLPPLSTLKDLTFNEYWDVLNWQDYIENVLWLELLRPFPALKHLFLNEAFGRRIAPALQEVVVGGRSTEVLPTLGNICLKDYQPSGQSVPVPEGIQQFVGARQLTSHPVDVSCWDIR